MDQMQGQTYIFEADAKVFAAENPWKCIKMFHFAK